MPTDNLSLTPARLVQLFQTHRKLLVAPAIVGAVLAALSTYVLPRDWKAEQGLVIRSDAAGYAEQRLGKFTDLSEMKTVQETLLELARSQNVVTAVLTEVLGAEPSRQDIADFRDKLRLTPPGGAEFGKTEVFYIGVLNPNRDRAIALVKALTKQLDLRLNELRDERATSMVAEVERSVDIARQQLHIQAERLAAYEGSIGADLIELRHLTNPSGGQSELGQKVLAIDAERRQYADRRSQNEALLTELQAALSDPSRILATPDALLSSQPALRRLKNGLIDAQLTVARTAGTRTMDHPLVVSARHGQEAVQRELIHELPTAIAGVQLELEVAARREAELAAQTDAIRSRSASLASQRSQYAELVASVDGQTAVLEKSLKQLADAKSALAGANSSSLLAPIDSVDTGVNPVGAGRTTVTAAGGLAGLLLGATLVFVLHAPRPEPTPNLVNRTPTATPAPAVRPTPVATAKPAPPVVTPAAAATKTPAVDPRTRREAIPLTTVSTIVTPQVRSLGA
jgi:succinoglycan biosynthesis transport protein ExoP